MPFMQAFVEKLNRRFNRWNIDSVDAALLATRAGVPNHEIVIKAAAGSANDPASAIQANQNEQDYLSAHVEPAALGRVRDALFKAVSAEPRVPVQFLWIPDDDLDKVTADVYEVAAPPGSGSMPGVSILLKGPTPK